MLNTEQLLAPFIHTKKNDGRPYSLKRMHKLLELFGNPQNALPVIHVAGTSGKTSTAYYTAALLHNAGVKVGLTVSPHISSITERVQVNGRPIPQDVFHTELQHFLKVVNVSGLDPTYFEVLMAFAYYMFANVEVDVSVIETGIGGLYDPSNVVTRPGKTCVITDIGYDHTELLGNTLELIAAQKAGIITERATVYMYQQSDEIMAVMKDTCALKNSILNTLTNDKNPDFKIRNFKLAEYVSSNWLASHNFPAMSLANAKRVLEELIVPARMERFSRRGKTVIIDGAHNPQKLRSFVEAFQAKYPGTKPVVICSFLQGPEDKLRDNCQELLKLDMSGLILTEFTALGKGKKQPVISSKLLEEFVRLGAQPMRVESAYKALEVALNYETSHIVVVGSLYLAAELRPVLI